MIVPANPEKNQDIPLTKATVNSSVRRIEVTATAFGRFGGFLMRKKWNPWWSSCFSAVCLIYLFQDAPLWIRFFWCSARKQWPVRKMITVSWNASRSAGSEAPRYSEGRNANDSKRFFLLGTDIYMKLHGGNLCWKIIWGSEANGWFKIYTSV